MTTVKLITAYDETFAELGDVTSAEMIEYGLRWKCDFDVERLNEQFDRPAAWYKVWLLLQEFKSNKSDWIVWIDADACIMNQSFDLRSYLDSIPESVWLVLGSDNNGINTGVMFVRNCKEAEEFFTEVYSRTEFLNHVWWEQAAVRKIIDEDYGVEYFAIEEPKEFYYRKLRTPNYDSQILVIPNATFNSYDPRYYSTGTYKQGDFILHCPSLPVVQRLAIIKQRLNAVPA